MTHDAQSKRQKLTCPRCGKVSRNAGDIHTCTPPVTDRALMQRALNFILFYNPAQPQDLTIRAELLTALRERLATTSPSAPHSADSADTFCNEPVGEIVPAFAGLTAVSIPVMPPVGTKLYTAPPRREWVSLTAVEVGTLTVFPGLFAIETPLLADFICAIEARLKEKNQ